MRQRVRSIALAVIVVIYFAIATLYALWTPKWQAPDEPAHLNYIRHIAETGTLPVLQPGDYDQAYLEKIKAAKFPATLSIDSIRYESYQPPLYYLAATPVYWLVRGASMDAIVLALRLFSIVLGALVLLVAFNVIHTLFPDDHVLALATVGLMATVPQHLAVSASISNDLAAELVLVLILWLAVKRIQRTLSDSQSVWLGGILFGAALLTKTTVYLPGAAILIGAQIASAKLDSPRFALRSLRLTFYSFVLALCLASPMFIRGALTYGLTDPLGIARHDAVVIGQPTTAAMVAQFGFKRIAFDFLAITFKSFWAQFGWMGVLVNDRIYVALAILCAIALLGLVFYSLRLVRQRDLLSSLQWAGIALLGALLLTAIADYLAYNFKFLQFQGRYLFVSLIAIAFGLVLGLRELVAREYVGIVLTLLYLAMLVLDLVCLFGFIVPQLRI